MVVLRRHANEIKLLKQSTLMDNENWRNNFKKQQATILSEKEAEMHELFKRDRDKHIDAVIERLENEANENKLQLEKSTENRIRCGVIYKHSTKHDHGHYRITLELYKRLHDIIQAQFFANPYKSFPTPMGPCID
ncbi:unnamed protein product [Diabrotica balteata]|uniref:Uncharacterized protein n=1 Tax=Diabrotica balteata TaxID=107213 RepID=A0A9N9X986_DIABA|nr:unnamed protein product [Diabrotica balteata]